MSVADSLVSLSERSKTWVNLKFALRRRGHPGDAVAELGNAFAAIYAGLLRQHHRLPNGYLSAVRYSMQGSRFQVGVCGTPRGNNLAVAADFGLKRE